jgi:hypothetical protein
MTSFRVTLTPEFPGLKSMLFRRAFFQNFLRKEFHDEQLLEAGFSAEHAFENF